MSHTFRTNFLQEIKNCVGKQSNCLKGLLYDAIKKKYWYTSPEIEEISETSTSITFNFDEFIIEILLEFDVFISEHLGKDYNQKDEDGEFMSKIISKHKTYKVKSCDFLTNIQNVKDAQ